MDHLILFAKYPQAGRVKTRLAEEVGAARAAELYRGMVEEVVRNTRPPKESFHRTLYLDPPEREPDFRKWFPGLKLKPQSGEGLGERLSQACAETFQQGAKKIVILGSDCLEVGSELIEASFTRLDVDDLVLGPASDGGYYLIGMKQFHPELFQNISWSSSQVLEQTLAVARELNLKTFQLPTLSDIDTYQDYQVWRRRA